MGTALLTSNTFAAPTIDGDISDADYTTIGTKENANAGFGANIDVSTIKYYADVATSTLYLGIEGKLDTGNSNGIGVWLGFDEVDGSDAGIPMGFIPSGGHYMGSSSFVADFEVDYMFALNPGGGATDVFFDATGFNDATGTAQFIGSSNQTGTSTTGPGSDGVFNTNQISFAFNNGGGANQGFEMSIPFASLGVTNAGFMKVFTFVTSNTGFFADVTVPGNVATGNPGFTPNFNTMAGGTYHTTPDAPLPVELSFFNAEVRNGGVQLKWQTESEVDNKGFVIKRRALSQETFVEIASYERDNSLTGQGNSTNPTFYTFFDSKELKQNETYEYLLSDIDLEGRETIHSENLVKVVYEQSLAKDIRFELKGNFPNPFNPSTRIEFETPSESVFSVQIYNILGELVNTLAKDKVSKIGTNFISWDGTDKNGNVSPSGVYLYQVSYQNSIQRGKMLLVK
ncbi:MAG: T9SS C-terminal target domain-containing protein [Calditrichaeota bacterium]|nr:MAG: T9SS C-terminal target domain-containing protein [Calditrichota bacterium]